MSDIVAAAEALQSEAEAIVERADENSEVALAEAARRMAEAQALAAQITEAALASELGKQITAQGERLSIWQQEMNNRFSTLENLIAEIKAGPPQAVVLNSSAPTLPQAEAPLPQAENPEASIPQPESDDTGGGVPDKPQARKAKRRKM